MNLLTDPFVWCVLQITLLSLLAWALCAVVRRWSLPGTAALPAAALAAIVVLTICAFSPWPAWWRFGPRLDATEAVVVANNNRSPFAPAAGEAQPGESAGQPAPVPAESANEVPPAEIAERPAASESPNATHPASAPTFSVPRWLASALGVLLGIGVAAGLLQIVGGLLSIRACRRSSRRVEDSELSEQLDILQAELGLTLKIELHESDRLTTAATCGWRQPVVLLPPSWREWTADQRRAVLAHELAHVAGGDYVACILAQFGLALHFYHPLVHWLVARLRLEQELAADATAAALAGGRRAYLTTLAELALHSQERSLGWPAHTFLPTPGTFLRRIEMLRDSKPATSSAPRRRSAIKWIAVGILLAGAALIAGLRGGPAISPFDRQAVAQGQPATASGGSSSSVIDLTYVTNDAKLLLAARPAQALAQEEIKSALLASATDAPPVLKLLTTSHLQQITLFNPASLELNRLDDEVIVVLQFDQPMSVDDLAKTGALPQKMKQLPPAPGADEVAAEDFAATSLNDKTLAIGRAGSLQKYLGNRRKGKPAIATGAAWEKVHKGTIVAALDLEVVRDAFAQQKPQDAPAELGALTPLWEDSEYVCAGIILEGKAVHFRAVATCENADLAADVADTAQAAITLARNSLRTLRQREGAPPAIAQLALQTAEGLLKTMKIERSDVLVMAQTSTTVPEVKNVAAGGLVEAVSGARTSAQRQVSMNILKQIMLAMHTWADAHGGRFPPPVIYGKDGKGKVPHSWRVELLPYLEQAPLYEAYNFDESWDSAANKKILEKMPALFRNPAEDEKSTYSSYFVLTPAELAAEGGKVITAYGKRDGVRFADILDGTSNTLAVVEAKREIPWTRPDDLVFDPDKPLPELGGFFKEGYNAAFCDGAVRFISKNIEPKVLKLLIMPQDGEPLPNF
jgi:beta-lactamase regulating signal transducer with metallopeptidase domain